MAENSNSGKRGGWKANYYYGAKSRFQKPKAKPVTINNLADGPDNTAGDEIICVSNEDESENAWRLYFVEELSVKQKKIIELKKNLLQEHFLSNPAHYNLKRIKEDLIVHLKLEVLAKDKTFVEKWPESTIAEYSNNSKEDSNLFNNFYNDLRDSPEEMLGLIGLAIHHTIIVKFPSPNQQPDELSEIYSNIRFNTKMINVRIVDFLPIVKIDSFLKDGHGKMVTVRGTVLRLEMSKLICKWMAFKCGLCGSLMTVKQKDPKEMTSPSRCVQGCKATSDFVCMRSSPFTRVVSSQLIHLEEIGETINNENIQHSLEVELNQDLVDSIFLGKSINLTGIIRVRSDSKKGNSNSYKVYIKANYIYCNEKALTRRCETFTALDMEAIAMINAEPSRIRLLVNSLCPTIYGHEMVKAGLLLGLFSGEGLLRDRRSESHVLIVGDPGIGKSKMLEACAEVAPIGVFICGKGSTSVGLTATAGANGTINAGALVLADKGVCCIDELDKIALAFQPLLEVMEQNVVTITKKGIKCSLPARTTIFAASNPVGGCYNKARNVTQNIKLNRSLLSRFDLVFILLDCPNIERDNLMAKHLQDRHLLKNKLDNSPFFQTSISSQASSSSHQTLQSNFTDDNSDVNRCLKQHLQVPETEKLDLLPARLLQNYIGYARLNVHPKLSPKAKDVLHVFYYNMKKNKSGVESIPVTNRQLEALIRLTLARARIDLAEVATELHARDVLTIFKSTMLDTMPEMDEDMLKIAQEISTHVAENVSSLSKATQVKRFLALLQDHSAKKNIQQYSTMDLKSLADGRGYSDIMSIIEKINHDGYLIKKGNNLYQIIL